MWHCFFFLSEEQHQIICTGPNHTPASPEELQKVGEYASLLRDHLHEVAQRLGISPDDLAATRKQASKCSPGTNRTEAEKSGLLTRFREGMPTLS